MDKIITKLEAHHVALKEILDTLYGRRGGFIADGMKAEGIANGMQELAECLKHLDNAAAELYDAK